MPRDAVYGLSLHKFSGPPNHCIDFIAVDTAHASKYKASDARVVEDRKTSDHAPIRVTLDK